MSGPPARLWGGLLALAGIVLVVISAAADSLGIGGASGFGGKQVAGVVVGAVAVVVGVALVAMAGRRTPPPAV